LPLRIVNGPMKYQIPVARSPFTSMIGFITLCCEKLIRSWKP